MYVAMMEQVSAATTIAEYLGSYCTVYKILK